MNFSDVSVFSKTIRTLRAKESKKKITYYLYMW